MTIILKLTDVPSPKFVHNRIFSSGSQGFHNIHSRPGIVAGEVIEPKWKAAIYNQLPLFIKT